MKILLLLLLPLNLYAMSFSHAELIYKRIIKANGFLFAQRLVLSSSNEVNAKSGVTSITINTGMLRFVKNDDEMAAVLGHEIAHWRLGHRGSTPANEYAADLKGSYIMHKAGYNICKGLLVVKRFNDGDSETHPASDKRYYRLCR